MQNEIVIRNMIRPEVDILVDWAAREGWNPGLHDADAFWATDSKAFIAAEYQGELIGGGAITAYDGRFGFMGFFIVEPQYRGRGFGTVLWHARRKRLIGRLQSGASIGLDGVFEMQEYYARGGFVFAHRNLRFCAEIPEHFQPTESTTENDAAFIPLASIPFDRIATYDGTCFPAPRSVFLKNWMTLPDACALGCLRDGELRGYGVIRRCRSGCKIGPLFADSVHTASALYDRLAVFAAGGPLYLDVPENNPAAIAFVRQRNMTEVFGCARMYLGSPPVLAHERIFGITTLELG